MSRPQGRHYIGLDGLKLNFVHNFSTKQHFSMKFWILATLMVAYTAFSHLSKVDGGNHYLEYRIEQNVSFRNLFRCVICFPVMSSRINCQNKVWHAQFRCFLYLSILYWIQENFPNAYFIQRAACIQYCRVVKAVSVKLSFINHSLFQSWVGKWRPNLNVCYNVLCCILSFQNFSHQETFSSRQVFCSKE